jgi:hypothetical protein
MQGGKNWFLPKEMNANRFFCDSHWLEIWSNHFYPSMGPNGGSVAMDSVMTGLPPDLEARGLEVQSVRRSCAGRAAAAAGTVVGCATTPGGWPWENGSQCGSTICSGAKCTLRAAGGKSGKGTAASGWTLVLGCAGCAVDLLQGFRQRVDTLSSLSPMCRVKWCRERRRTA